MPTLGGTISLLLLVLSALLGLRCARIELLASTQENVSEPGVYTGYSKPSYTEWVRSSEYVAVRDGTKLAVDIYRPAVGGARLHLRQNRIDLLGQCGGRLPREEVD